MAILFRDDDSVVAKLYTLLMLSLILFALYGIWVNFSPSDYTKENFSIYSIFLAIILCIPIYLDKHPKNKLKENPFALLLVIYPSVVALLYFLIVYSVPAVIVSHTGSEFYTTGQINKKSSNKWRKGCNNRISVKDIYNENYRYRLCSNSRFVEKIIVNEYLILEGKDSKYGRLINSFALHSEL